MRLPLLRLPTVYHLGTLNPQERGQRFRSSYEGAGLSVSLCPHAWEQIARLGGQPLHTLSKPDAVYLDLHQLTSNMHDAISQWAIDQGLAEERVLWRAYDYDSEEEEIFSLSFPSREQAVEQVLFSLDVDVEGLSEEDALEAARRRLEDESNLEIPEVVAGVATLVLTEAGSTRACGFGRDSAANDMAAMFWAEDVARQTFPSLVGVWWQETFEPSALSAPRGAVFPSCISMLTVDEAYAMDDEDLLEGMPGTQFLSADDCMSLSGERIEYGAMRR